MVRGSVHEGVHAHGASHGQQWGEHMAVHTHGGRTPETVRGGSSWTASEGAWWVHCDSWGVVGGD
eukprot:45002-Prorocentrum_lima.AAC.1